MSKTKSPQCAKCVVRICASHDSMDTEIDISSAPGFCPMKTDQEIFDRAMKEYEKPDVNEFARQASIQEAQCYEEINGELRTKIPRVEETIQFAKKMNYRKLGIVFCIGFSNEALIFNKMLDKHGFEVVSACCKTGVVPKEKIGLKPEEKIRKADIFEAMCNPIAQALVMNKEKPDMVIVMGLCVGHDTLFLKYCDRPVTVLAVKDRVLAHNPLGAIYISNTAYYGRLLPENTQ